MAVLRGKGAFKDVPLIATVYNNNYFTTKKGVEGNAFVEFRIHPDDPRAEGQIFPELRAARIGETEDGKPRYERRSVLYAGQVEDMKEAAGDNTFPLLDSKGDQVGECYVVVADLTQTKPREGFGLYKYKSKTERIAPDAHLVPIAKTFRAADPQLAAVIDGKTPLDRSFDMIREAREAKRAEKEGATPVATAEVVIEQPDLETPEMDGQQTLPF